MIRSCDKERGKGGGQSRAKQVRRQRAEGRSAFCCDATSFFCLLTPPTLRHGRGPRGLELKGASGVVVRRQWAEGRNRMWHSAAPHFCLLPSAFCLEVCLLP